MKLKHLVAAALLLTAPLAFADVDVSAAMPVLLKVLTYDQNFDARGAGTFTLLVVSDPSGASARDSVIANLKNMPVTRVKNRPVAYVGVDYRDENQLQNDIDKHHPAALLALPGTSMESVKHLWDVAQDNQLYALALDEAMVEKVLPLGVTMVGGKPQIIINEKASKAVGVRFETSVLRLARVIQ